MNEIKEFECKPDVTTDPNFKVHVEDMLDSMVGAEQTDVIRSPFKEPMACGGCAYFFPYKTIQSECRHPKNLRYDEHKPTPMPPSNWNLHGMCDEHTARKHRK